MSLIAISSHANGHIKHAVRLRDEAKERKNEGLVYLEGWRLIKDCPIPFLREIYFSERFYSSLDEDKEKSQWVNALPDILTFLLPDNIFKKISDTKTPQGIIALAEYRTYHSRELAGFCEGLTHKPLLLGAQDLSDAGNMGMIIRSALGAGADGVIISKASTDPLSPKALRASMGAGLKLPVFLADDFIETLLWMKSAQIKIYAAAALGSICYHSCDYNQPSLIAVGNEASGLSQEVLALADQCVSIPLHGDLESLNAGAAATVLLFEAQRQRQNIEKRSFI